MEMFFWDSLCGMYIQTETFGFDASPDRTRAHFALAFVPGGPIPACFWVAWEGHPLAHTHLATIPNAVAERGKKPFV